MSEMAGFGRRRAATADYGVVTAPDAVRLECVLPGGIDRVWSHLTESDKRAAWLASGDMELLVGGDVKHVFRKPDPLEHEDAPKRWPVPGETRMRGFVVACEAPRLLAYTWGSHWSRRSEVSFELTPGSDGVRLVLTHRRLASRDEVMSAGRRWHTHLRLLSEQLAGVNATSPSGVQIVAS
jgi:uncharacterized protein YndB with AHSA1/START domain